MTIPDIKPDTIPDVLIRNEGTLLVFCPLTGQQPIGFTSTSRTLSGLGML